MTVVQEVTMDVLRAALDGAAIDWDQNDNGSIYAQGGQPGCWVDIVSEGKLLSFLTFWPLREGVEELAALRLANRGNNKFTMIQFDVSLERGRVYGQWHLQLGEGLTTR